MYDTVQFVSVPLDSHKGRHHLPHRTVYNSTMHSDSNQHMGHNMRAPREEWAPSRAEHRSDVVCLSLSPQVNYELGVPHFESQVAQSF
jgi:hypothetical protein